MRFIAVSLAVSTFAIAAEPIELPGIHNTFRVTPRVFSGSQPEGDAAFAALAKLGVKTIISVDGAKPDVSSARKHGLRYIHLPLGYDEVPAARVPELAVAAGGDGKVFVHCHHGKHRGPTAIAVICAAADGWTPAKAEAWLREAGTGTEYAGLYRSVREFKPVTKEQLAKVGPLSEITKTPAIVDAMVEIDERHEALKAAQKDRWRSDTANDAALMWEHFRELARTEDTKSRAAEYRAIVTASEAAANDLRKSKKPPTDPGRADAAMKELSANCTKCHKAYRN